MLKTERGLQPNVRAMKFKLHQSTFLEALKSVQGGIGSRSANMPILSNVLIEANDETLVFTTTDFDVTVRFSCKAEVVEPGSITLPLKRLTSIVGVLSDQVVEIASDPKQDGAIRMTCGSYRSKITGIPAKEFPPIAKPEGGSTFKLDQAIFKESLRKTAYAAAVDDSRPVLMGVLLSFADGKLTTVATDGRRLALFWTELDFPEGQNCNAVLPARAVKELLRSLTTGEMKITVKETQAIFEFGDHFFSTTLMSGQYPDYKQVVFTDCENKIKVNREELIAVLQRISVSTTPTTNAMRLTFENNLLTIAVTSPDVDEATDTVTIKYDGPSITTIFNPEFMLVPLTNLTSDEITIELNNASSPDLIKDETTFLYLIMPLRV